MSKLLSYKEAKEIATKMTREYGLPPPILDNTNYFSSNTWGFRVEIVRPIKVRLFEWFPWPKRTVMKKVRDFYSDNLEDALTKLQQELTRFDSQAEVAEAFREKYANQEADEVLDKVLRDV